VQLTPPDTLLKVAGVQPLAMPRVRYGHHKKEHKPLLKCKDLVQI